MIANGKLVAHTSIDAHEQAREIFSHAMYRSESALAYLRKCGVSEETCIHYNLGVSDIYSLAEHLGIPDKDLVNAGLIPGRMDSESRFTKTITMPIYDSSMSTVGFLTQEIPHGNDKSKAHSIVLHKDVDDSGLLFGVDEFSMDRENVTCLVSCPMEVLGLHSQGVCSAVSPVGDEITQSIVTNVFSGTRGVHFLLPSIIEKAYLAKQALDSTVASVGTFADRQVRLSFLPRPYRHCNAFMATNREGEISNVLKRYRDIPELIYRKIGSATGGLVERAVVLECSRSEFAAITDETVRQAYRDKLLRLAGYYDARNTVENNTPCSSSDTPKCTNPPTASSAPPSAHVPERQAIAAVHAAEPVQQVSGVAEPAQFIIDIPQWVDALLACDKYRQQRERCGRKAPKNEKVASAIAAIDSNNSRLHMKNLASYIGMSPMRVRGFIGGLRSLLNFDGTPVISLEEETDTLSLDVKLLKSQFKL